MTKRYDIIVVGGGLAGLPMGLALAQGGFEVAVIDRLDPAAATDAAFDGRASAIAFACSRMLDALDVMPRLAGQTQPINDIMVTDGRVSEGASPFFLHFDHREIGDEPLGEMVENRHMRIAQLAAAEVADGLDLIAPAEIVSTDIDDKGTTVTLADGRVLSARLCIAADGRQSRLRQQLGIRTLAWDYNQAGIVCMVEHEAPHKGVAQEYFLSGGPFAILPITGNRSSLVWTERTKTAKAIMALNDADFTDELRARFGDYLGVVAPVGPRWSYPLAFHIAYEFIRPGFAMVGDAAHGIHPIAGQGLNLGLRDVAALAEVLTETRRLGLDFGSLDTLERYQRWRRFDTVALAGVTDGLNRLFSNDLAPVRLARDIGLGVVGKLGPARRLFMRHAGGGVGDLPRLLRGEAV